MSSNMYEAELKRNKEDLASVDTRFKSNKSYSEVFIELDQNIENLYQLKTMLVNQFIENWKAGKRVPGINKNLDELEKLIKTNNTKFREYIKDLEQIPNKILDENVLNHPYFRDLQRFGKRNPHFKIFDTDRESLPKDNPNEIFIRLSRLGLIRNLRMQAKQENIFTDLLNQAGVPSASPKNKKNVSRVPSAPIVRQFQTTATPLSSQPICKIEMTGEFEPKDMEIAKRIIQSAPPSSVTKDMSRNTISMTSNDPKTLFQQAKYFMAELFIKFGIKKLAIKFSAPRATDILKALPHNQNLEITEVSYKSGNKTFIETLEQFNDKHAPLKPLKPQPKPN